MDIKIEFTGLRPGEKMYEELYLDRESMARTRNEHIFMLTPITDPEQVRTELSSLVQLIDYPSPELDHLLDRTIINPVLPV